MEQRPVESKSSEGEVEEVPPGAHVVEEEVPPGAKVAREEICNGARQNSKEEHDAATRVAADVCKKALSKWLMEDSSSQDIEAFEKNEKSDVFAAAVAKGVCTAQSLATDVPSVRVSLGEHGANGEVILGWRDDEESCQLWCPHEREADFKSAFRSEPNSPSTIYIVCHVRAGHMFLCRFDLGVLPVGSGQHYFVMSSPPEVTPMFMVRSLECVGPASLCPVLDSVLPCPSSARNIGSE